MAATRRQFVEWAVAVVPACALSAEPTESRAMSNDTDANKKVIAGFIDEVWTHGRLDELPKFWTRDCVNHADPSSDNTGLLALRHYHEGFAKGFAAFEGPSIELQQQVAEHDRVVTQMVTRAVHRDTGRHVALATIRIDRLLGGKIAEHWSVADMAGLMQQIS